MSAGQDVVIYAQARLEIRCDQRADAAEWYACERLRAFARFNL